MARHPVRPRRQAWYGLRRDTRDQRDHIFNVAPVHLPPSADLRQWCPPVMDQGELGSCTAHGITAALRFGLIKAGKPDVPLSRLQLYYDERAIEGTIRSDAGAEIRDGIKTAAKLGVGPESLWPYTIAKFVRKPPAAVYKAALDFQALTYQRVTVAVSSLKAALATGFPVVIGISVYESFEGEDVAKTGIVPLPGEKEQLAGGHCMLAVGYGQKPGFFTVQNSWASDWGDKGFCYLPEAYLGSPKLGSDYWLINTVG